MNRKRLWNIALAISVIIVVTIGASLLVGVRYATVRSASMAPDINTGDVVILTPTNAADIHVNDVVAFHPPGSSILICHRVIAIDLDGGYVQTKGDANEAPDWFVVPLNEIQGKVVSHIPYLGYLVSYEFSIYGIGTTIMWVGIVLVIGELIKKDVDDEGEEKERDKEEVGGTA
jgi:signal peptidase